MRRLILVFAMMGVAVLLASGVALGITNGWVDDGRADNAQEPDPNIIKYSYVGALVDRFDGETYPYCTGTLIAPDVLLTAAHCYPETTRHFGVTFDAKYRATSTLYSGTFHDHPILDIAVVKFNQDIPGIDPAKLPNLPTAGQFNNAAKGSKFTAVGYGGYLAPKEPGGPVIAYEDQREWSVGTLNSVNRTYLRLSQNRGSGGTCYGDSGGPNFLGEYPYNYDPNHVPIIASTTITGDTWCKSTNVTLRLDTESARGFLDDYVTLP